jgi:hypothetical protein
MNELLLHKKSWAVLALPQTFSAVFCILAAAEQVELITVAVIATVVLAAEAEAQCITQARILTDQDLVTEATAAVNH